MSKKRKLLAWLLMLVMLVGLLPAAAFAADAVSVTPTKEGAHGTASGTVAVGESLTVSVENTSQAAKTYTVTTDKSGIVSVPASFEVAAQSTDTFTVTGVAAGTVVVSLDGINSDSGSSYPWGGGSWGGSSSSGSHYYADVTITVTGEGGEEPTPVDPPVTDVFEITAKSGGETKSASVEANGTLTVSLTNGSSYNEKTYAISVGDSSVAKTSVTSLTIAKGGTETFTITGLKGGSTTVTATASSGGGSSYVATINLSVTGGEPTPVDPPVDPTPTGSVNVTPTKEGTHGTASGTVAVGKSLTVNVENTSQAAKTYTVTTDKSGIVSVPASFEVAAQSTDTFTVTGVAAGTVVVSLDGINSDSGSSYPWGGGSSSGSHYYADVTVTVTGEGGGEEPVDPPTPSGNATFVKASSIENGKEYLFVGKSGSGSNGYALQNGTEPTGKDTDNGQKKTITLSDSITLSADEAKNIVWKAVQSGNGFSFVCDGKYLSKANNSSLQMANSAESFTVSGTQVRSGSSTLCYGSNSASSTYIFNFNSSANDAVTVYVKQGGGQDEPDEPVVPTGDGLFLAFTSDVHNDSDDSSAVRLNNWINAVTKTLNAKLTDFGFCGDLGPATGTFWPYAERVIETVEDSENVLGNGFYVCGNHEWSPGSFGSTNEPAARKYTVNGNYIDTGSYVLYSFGALSSSYNHQNVDKLDAYLSGAPTDRPIFILSHFPLHDYGYHAVNNEEAVISTLNKYGDTHTIIFLWGHNHTEGDNHYNKFYTGKLDNTSINFTYASAGCLADDTYGSSDSVNDIGLVASLDGATVTLAYYTVNGTMYGSPLTLELGDSPVTPATKYTITATAGANGSVSPASASVTEGRSQTFTFTPNAGYELDTVKVDGETVSVSGNSYTFQNVKEAHTLSVTFKKADSSKVTTLTYASSATAGGQYVLVSNGYALVNNNGSISAVKVTESGNTAAIQTADLAKATFTFSAASGSNKSGDFEIASGSYIFTRLSDASGNAQKAGLTTGKPSSEHSGLPYYQWSYANDQLSQVGGQDKSATFYVYYNSSASAFYTASEAQTLKLYVVSSTPAHVHDWGEGVITKEATCTEDGVLTFTCSCGETKTEVIAKLGHDLVHHEAQAPSCTLAGLEAYDTCSRCDYATTAKVIPALGHNWDNGSVTTLATCTEDGVRTFTCTVCKDTKTEPVEKLGHLLTHYDSQNATCTDDGWYAYDACSRCGYSSKVVIPATGHNWGEGVVTTEATCTEDGVLTFTCATCKDTKTETVEKLGHDLSHHEAQAVSCTQDGWAAYDTCSRCDYSSKTVIPATGHDWTDWVVTKNVSCEEDGEEARACTVCSDTETKIIPKTGHHYGSAWVSDETDHWHECDCGATANKGAHLWQSAGSVSATCTSDGYVSSLCLVCGKTNTVIEPATGHNFVDGECTVCHEKDPDYIQKLESFVQRFYNVFFNRDGKDNEIAHYVNLMSEHGWTGGQVAAEFVFGDEFKVRCYCDEHYAEALYVALMDRAPVAGETEYYVYLMQQGASRKDVFRIFVSSPEFAAICSEYGIRPGADVDLTGKTLVQDGYCTVAGCTAHEPVVAFVTRLYNVCLDRTPQQNEIDAWHYYLVHGDATASSAVNYFLTQSEFVSKHYDNVDFASHLYLATMGREASEADISYVVWKLRDLGVSREDMIAEFVAALEFKVMCQAFNVRVS